MRYLYTTLIGCALMLSGCNPIYYTSTTQQVPMLKEAGEVSFSGGRGSAKDLNLLEFQGSVAITKHIAIMGGFHELESEENTLGRGGGSIREIAVGYYHYKGEKSSIRILGETEYGWSYDVFGGYGWGSGFIELYEMAYGSNGRYTSFDLDRYFIQTSLGYFSDYADVALSSRITQLTYKNVENRFPHDEYDLKRNANQTLWEPALTVRYGYKFIKLQGQVGFAVNLKDSDFPLSPGHSSICLMLDIRPSWFKKN